jgi:hypothetical protein
MTTTNQEKVMKFRLLHDSEAESPREDMNNLGTMVCWHSRYNLGDKHNWTVDQFHLMVLSKKDIIALPLFLMDHSGLSMRCHSYGDHWDSGHVGWIFTTREKAKDWFQVTRWNNELKEDVKSILRNEVYTYSQYLEGDVWGFEVYSEEPCKCCGQIIKNELVSVWGFYGCDPKKNGMLDYIPKEYHYAVEQGSD